MRLILFILFPALELYLLVKVGGIIGALNMVFWVFASAAIGLWAARTQGQSAMLKVQAELAEGRVPQNNFMNSLLLFFGGVLLILPGLITDAVGLFLLIPPFRHFAATAASRYIVSRQAAGQSSQMFIFRGAPGAGGGFGFTRFSGGFPGGSADPFQGAGCRPGPGEAEAFDVEAQSPRQATVLESEAIDITPAGDQNGRKSSEGPGGKE